MRKYIYLLGTLGAISLGATGVYEAFQQSNTSGFSALGGVLIVFAVLLGLAKAVEETLR